MIDSLGQDKVGTIGRQPFYLYVTFPRWQFLWLFYMVLFSYKFSFSFYNFIVIFKDSLFFILRWKRGISAIQAAPVRHRDLAVEAIRSSNMGPKRKKGRLIKAHKDVIVAPSMFLPQHPSISDSIEERPTATPQWEGDMLSVCVRER